MMGWPPSFGVLKKTARFLAIWLVASTSFLAHAQTAPDGVDPTFAWMVSSVGPMGIVAVLLYRALGVADRAVTAFNGAVAEAQQWRLSRAWMRSSREQTEERAYNLHAENHGGYRE
jgi:threonine dehydrogenase-like Zn-dependent dehydrogenase